MTRAGALNTGCPLVVDRTMRSLGLLVLVGLLGCACPRDAGDGAGTGHGVVATLGGGGEEIEQDRGRGPDESVEEGADEPVVVRIEGGSCASPDVRCAPPLVCCPVSVR